MKILVIGFGYVGQQIAEILYLEKEKYADLSSLDLSITGLFTKTRGALLDPSGIDMPTAIRQIQDSGYFSDNNPQITSQSLLQAIHTLEYDILVELSTLSIENRGEPALSYIREALKRKKHVVTANKGPVAFAYDELIKLARKNGVKFQFESTVMDGTPVFNLAEHTLKGATITGVSGILNSTTNYILSEMEKGNTFQEALAFAQKEGFAEADPQNDIDGWDAAAKIAALSNVLMKAGITPFDVEREGITEITPEIISSARKQGNRLKLICRAWYEGDRIHTRVMPEEIPQDDPFAVVNGSGACLKIESDLMNPILIMQDSPTVKDTAYGVLNDILTIQEANII